MSASIELNLQADFFQNIIRNAEQEQAEKQYRYAIPDTVYGNGTQGGLAVLTARTRPSASFEGKPISANCRIPVTFQIKDKTYVASEGAMLDKKTLEFVVTRKLTGNRKAPTETISVTGPQSLLATFTPDYFDKKDITWSVSEDSWISVNGENRSASVSAFLDAKWIKDTIEADLAAYKNNWKTVQTGTGKRSAVVTVEAEDMLGHREYAECQVTVKFETVDQTYLYGGGSGSSSGGGSSGGSGGGAKGNSSGNSLKKTEKDPSGPGAVFGSVTGLWSQNEHGYWMFKSGDALYRDMWAYVFNPYAKENQDQADWFRFDEQGYMKTGWHTDDDGNTYYLWPYQDGTQGHMVTGWRWIRGNDGNERCYYFNPVSDGTRGRLFKNETTPDGYQVNEDGVWTMDGVEQIRKLK